MWLLSPWNESVQSVSMIVSKWLLEDVNPVEVPDFPGLGYKLVSGNKWFSTSFN